MRARLGDFLGSLLKSQAVSTTMIDKQQTEELTATHGRTYEVRTFGCQMNVHDSERLSGLLEDAGYQPVPTGKTPDLVVFNTCAVRENADLRLYGTLGHLRSVKEQHPGMQIAVGGCLAQKDKDTVVEKAPWVDVVFGTHNIGSLPTLLKRAAHNRRAQVEIVDSLEQFPSVLPAKRESAYAGWVSVSVGCNNTCTFCIVPSLRGKEIDRRPGDVLAEVQALVDQGVLEVTLLGQNVNAYGVNFADPEVARDRSAFSKLLRACGDISGLERLRFTYKPFLRLFVGDLCQFDGFFGTADHFLLHDEIANGHDDVFFEAKFVLLRGKLLDIEIAFGHVVPPLAHAPVDERNGKRKLHKFPLRRITIDIAEGIGSLVEANISREAGIKERLLSCFVQLLL